MEKVIAPQSNFHRRYQYWLTRYRGSETWAYERSGPNFYTNNIHTTRYSDFELEHISTYFASRVNPR